MDNWCSAVSVLQHAGFGPDTTAIDTFSIGFILDVVMTPCGQIKFEKNGYLKQAFWLPSGRVQPRRDDYGL